MIDIR